MRIRKIKHIEPNMSKVIGISDSPNDKDVYSSNVINKILAYSTEEQMVGILENGKPFYRKKIVFKSNSSPYTYNHGISDIEEILWFNGKHLRKNETTARPLTTYNSTYPTYYTSLDSVTPNKIEIFAGDSVKEDLTWCIWLYYTKTTD